MALIPKAIEAGTVRAFCEVGQHECTVPLVSEDCRFTVRIDTAVPVGTRATLIPDVTGGLMLFCPRPDCLAHESVHPPGGGADPPAVQALYAARLLAGDEHPCANEAEARAALADLIDQVGELWNWRLGAVPPAAERARQRAALEAHQRRPPGPP